MHVIIIHGSFGKPESNWFPYVKKELQKLGHTLYVPQFPIENWDKVTKDGPHVPLQHQYLRNWIKTFDELYQTLDRNEKIVFIGHSIACVFILHIIQKYKMKVKEAIFVAPFLNTLNTTWQIDYVNQTFYKKDFDFEELKKHISHSTVLYSDNDPYVKQEYSVEFGNNLDSEMIEIENAGHMNEESGYTEFPLVVNLCKNLVI